MYVKNYMYAIFEAATRRGVRRVKEGGLAIPPKYSQVTWVYSRLMAIKRIS